MTSILPRKARHEERVTFGEVFTRRWIVDTLLDLVEYVPETDLPGKVLVDPCAGGGAFLTARRIPPADETGVESWARGSNTDLATVDPEQAPTHTVCPTCHHRRRIVVNVGGTRRNGNGDPGINGDGAAKLRKNELYGLVRNFITSQPGHVFTYGDIARELSLRHGRTISSGAVRNNVDKLLAEGVAERANPSDPHDMKVTAAAQPAAG